MSISCPLGRFSHKNMNKSQLSCASLVTHRFLQKCCPGPNAVINHSKPSGPIERRRSCQFGWSLVARYFCNASLPERRKLYVKRLRPFLAFDFGCSRQLIFLVDPVILDLTSLCFRRNSIWTPGSLYYFSFGSCCTKLMYSEY